MIGLLRNLIVIVAILTAVYVALSYIGRLRAADKVRGEFIKTKAEVSEAEFMNKGLARYQKSLRRKLIIRVYLIPLFIAGVLIYLAQYG